MSAVSTSSEVQSGLAGVVAFETEIAEPDKEGGALRYRGVDIESLVGNYVFESEKNRAVAVHSAAIIEALRKLYDAAPLVDELAGAASVSDTGPR